MIKRHYYADCKFIKLEKPKFTGYVFFDENHNAVAAIAEEHMVDYRTLEKLRPRKWARQHNLWSQQDRNKWIHL